MSCCELHKGWRWLGSYSECKDMQRKEADDKKAREEMELKTCLAQADSLALSCRIKCAYRDYECTDNCRALEDNAVDKCVQDK